MSLHRIEGWEGRLADFVAQARALPFQWAVFDCCSMPCQAVQIITGVDPLAELRGRYQTELGALRILRRFAGGGVTEMIEKITENLDVPEVEPPFARRGDIVLYDDLALVQGPFNAALGLCLGRDVAVVELEGLRLWPLARASRAWAFG